MAARSGSMPRFIISMMTASNRGSLALSSTAIAAGAALARRPLPAGRRAKELAGCKPRTN